MAIDFYVLRHILYSAYALTLIFRAEKKATYPSRRWPGHVARNFVMQSLSGLLHYIISIALYYFYRFGINPCAVVAGGLHFNPFLDAGIVGS